MENKTSQAQLAASRKYQKDHTKTMSLQFNIDFDADILEKLNQVANKQGYIKNLIRQDLLNSKDQQYSIILFNSTKGL